MQIRWQRVFRAENQGNHQNFDTSLLTYKCWLIFMAMKQKKIFFLKKKIQNGRLKKRSFSISANSQYFFSKFSWMGPWVSRIDWCEGHWWDSTYLAVRLSDIRCKTAKKCFFCVFWMFLSLCGQPHGHIHWASSMPFTSINPTNPKTNLRNFRENFLRIGDFEKRCFFESAILNFIFQKK